MNTITKTTKSIVGLTPNIDPNAIINTNLKMINAFVIRAIPDNDNIGGIHATIIGRTVNIYYGWRCVHNKHDRVNGCVASAISSLDVDNMGAIINIVESVVGLVSDVDPL